MANPFAAFLGAFGQALQTGGQRLQERHGRTRQAGEREDTLRRAVFIRMGIDPDSGAEIPGFRDAQRAHSAAKRKPRGGGRKGRRDGAKGGDLLSAIAGT
jgi:hypothetical protein